MKPVIWVPAWAACLTLGLCAYQLSLPNSLLGIHGLTNAGYDDSVYLGMAIRFVHGVLPYRDFDFVQPPGIGLIMAPVALVGELIGARDAMAIARILTALAASANAALAALALRRHGTLSMWVSGTALAIFPPAFAADHSLTLEPYLVLFTLIGTVLVFGEDTDSSRTLLLGGIAFGFAGAVKTWAVLPAAAALLCLLPKRRRLRLVATGMALGFVLPCLPFFGAAPGAFVHDVIVAQLSRKHSVYGDLSVMERLLLISGLKNFAVLHASTGTVTIALAAAAGVLVVLYALRRRHLSRLEVFVSVAVAFILAGVFASPEFFNYYTYFPGTFLALLAGVAAWLVRDVLASFVQTGQHKRTARTSRKRHLAGLTGVGAVLVVVGLVVAQDTSSAASFLASSFDPAATVAREIPAGSCVIFDYPSIAIASNRFTPRAPGCPATVDPFGMWLARDDGASPPTKTPPPAAFSASWQRWIERADYMVLAFPEDEWIPWTSQMLSYFDANYVLLSSKDHVYVYDHFDRAPSGQARTLVDKGIAVGDAGDARRAASYFQAALRLDPADVYATFDLGVTAQNRGRDKISAGYYRRTIKLDPLDTSAMYNLAIIYASNQPSKAYALYTRILAIKPDAPRVQLDYGLLLVKHGHVKAGDALLAKAITEDPALRSQLPPGVSVK